jgi:8-oxo-dGTP diphosphatase
MARSIPPVKSSIRFFDPGDTDDTPYTFVIMVCRYREHWLWVRHRNRETWELPAGHVEPGESVTEAAHRELFEETGALDYTLFPLVSYEGTYEGRRVFGRIFLVRIRELGHLPDFEIRETALFDELPDKMTYPEIQPRFFDYVVKNLWTSLNR